MKHLLALLLLVPSVLLAQDNPSYDPDYNGDGCYTATDLLGLLPLFGSCGFACGDPIFFDNYWYETVLISDQCWFAENLRTTVYADSTSIPEVTGNFAWVGLSTGARCDYENNAFFADTYGRLYNWYAVDDVRGLCPSGWHVPTHDDWIDLRNYIVSQGFVGLDIGPALQSNTGWTGTDNFGFSALPGGFRSGDFGDTGNLGGFFFSLGNQSAWWSSSLIGTNTAWFWYIQNVDPDLVWYYGEPTFGYSVRCLKDAE